MMFATPVLSSAWSSTTSTRAWPAAPATASVCNMDLRGQRRRFPGQHDFGAVARRRDDRQRRADSLRTLLHAGHAESAGGPLPGDPAAVVGDREAEAKRSDGRCLD